MKQYHFPDPALASVSDGDIFIFSFALDIPKVTLRLLVVYDLSTYSVDVKEGATFAGALSHRKPKGPQDANVVIRVDKISPDSFTTYINGDMIGTTKAYYTGQKIKKAAVFCARGVDLAIFDSRDREMAEVFAEAMRNPSPKDLETWDRVRKTPAIDGSDMIAPTPDREKALEAREKEVAYREREVADREKEVAVREKEVAGREKLALEKFEKSLEAREKALERRFKYTYG